MTRSKTALVAALAATASCLPAIAAAQDMSATSTSTGAEDGEDIVVRGYAASLAKAREAKKNSNIVKDVIIAEDMAKFPELNLAESIQRLPGVAINREGGEGRRITLRGLGPEYTRVQLNGLEVLGNVDSAMDSRGQRSRDRAFDFNIFASELFSRVEVEKSYEAAQNEGGMAGTVGLFTGKPFDYAPGLKGAASAKLGTNSNTDDTQKRFAGMLSKNWDNRFGILVSAAWSKRRTQEQGYNTYSPSQLSASQLQGYVDDGLDISALSAAQQEKFLSGDLVFASGNRQSVWNADQERLGLTMAMQWQPTDTLLLTLDGLHGEFTTHRNEYHLATRPRGTSGSVAFDTGSAINGISWDDTNFVNMIDVDDATYASEHRRSLNKNKFNQIALTGKWEPTDRFSADGHFGYEKSKYTTPYDDKLYLEATGGMTTTYAADGRSANNAYDWDTTDTGAYTFREFYFREFWNQTNLTDGALNLHYKLDDALTLRAGGGYRRYNTSGSEVYNDGKAQEFDGTPAGSFSGVFNDYDGPSWVVGNYADAFAFTGYQHSIAGATDIENTYNVTETTKTGYVQLDWDMPLGGMRLRGNLGGRAYFTDVSGTGQIINGDYTPIGDRTSKSNYSGFLPALNATLEVTPSFLVRFAASKNVNRPALASMAPIASVDRSDGVYSISVGNPDLKPYSSTALDFSAEWYFGNVGMLTLGVFHKDIQDLIYTDTQTNIAFGETGLPTSLYDGLTNDTIIESYSRPVNLSKAFVTGLEVAGQANFTFLPAPFDKLGASANLTVIDSGTKNGEGSGRIPGLSKTNANGTLYYETDRWGLRGSLNYRSSYLRTIYDGSDPTSEDGFEGTIYVDAAAFVNIGHGIKLTIDAINLTNETEVQYNSIYHRLHNETQSGRTVYAGVSFDF